MAKKPFPFKVCEQCCSGSGGEGGETVIIKEGTYKYFAVDLADVIYNIFLGPNEVTYVHGVFSNEELNFYVDNGDIANDAAEESVLILDLTEMSEIPQISIGGGGAIKWINGEPPKIEAGKVYMFSFVRAKLTTTTELGSFYFLGIGGEFA